MGQQPTLLKKLMYAISACSSCSPLKLYNITRMFHHFLTNRVLRSNISSSKKSFFSNLLKYLQKQCLFYGSRKIAPSPNFKASRKPNPDPDQGQFSGHPFLYNEFLAIFTKVFVILLVA